MACSTSQTGPVRPLTLTQQGQPLAGPFMQRLLPSPSSLRSYTDPLGRQACSGSPEDTERCERALTFSPSVPPHVPHRTPPHSFQAALPCQPWDSPHLLLFTDTLLLRAALPRWLQCLGPTVLTGNPAQPAQGAPSPEIDPAAPASSSLLTWRSWVTGKSLWVPGEPDDQVVSP